MPDDLDALIQARADKVRASVSHREPVAWAVMLPDGDRIYDVYAIEEEAKAIDEAVTGNHGVVPLCRSPTLTDAEREAVQFAAFLYEQGGRADDAATLRGLLERLK
jgi:hypothetical protein